MILTLAVRNLLHDRIRLAVTLVGIMFAVVLVTVQLGLYLGARQMIVGMIEHAKGDLWITAYGASSFEQAPLMSGRERYSALSVPGVSTVTPLIVSFAEWRKPDSGTTNVVVVGADPQDGGLSPWNVIEGGRDGIITPDGVAADKSYLGSLGIGGTGSAAEIESSRVRVTAMTDGIRSFTTSPYIFTSLNKARNLLNVPSDQATFYLVSANPGVDIEGLRQELSSRLSNVSVLTKAQFLKRNLDYWLFGTGAGVALLGGAALGLIVGTVIVAQTLYSSTKDHMNEFATLRALGSSSAYLHKVILAQAAFSAILGYALGMAVAIVVVLGSGKTALPIALTPALAGALFGLTVAMCAISALSSIVKVTKLDPAMVFTR